MCGVHYFNVRTCVLLVCMHLSVYYLRCMFDQLWCALYKDTMLFNRYDLFEKKVTLNGFDVSP